MDSHHLLQTALVFLLATVIAVPLTKRFRLGAVLGYLLAGVAITLTSGIFPGTHGYQAAWGICAAAILLSLVPLRALRRAAGDPGRA